MWLIEWWNAFLESFKAKKAPTPLIPPMPYPPVPIPTVPILDTPGQKLYKKALSFLGVDASPDDFAPDDVACAETVCDIVHGTFGDFPGDGKTIISTQVLVQKLRTHPKFVLTTDYEPGNIIISPTGSGNGNLEHGHTGIFGEDRKIMSNDSATGLFKQNYNLDSWVARYRTLGGFRIFIFKRIEM